MNIQVLFLCFMITFITCILVMLLSVVFCSVTEILTLHFYLRKKTAMIIAAAVPTVVFLVSLFALWGG